MISDKDVEKLKGTFATKEDLKRFATKEDLKNSTEETKRHFDVVAEDIKSSITLLAEQVSANTEKLTNIEETDKGTQKEIISLKNRVSVLETK